MLPLSLWVKTGDEQINRHLLVRSFGWELWHCSEGVHASLFMWMSEEWKDHNAQVCTGPWVSDLVFFQLLTSFLLHGSPSLVLLYPLLLQSSLPLLQLLLIVLPSSLLTRLPLGLLDSWGMVHVDRRIQLAMTWCMCMCVFTCALARTHKKKKDIITWAHTHTGLLQQCDGSAVDHVTRL